MEMFGCGRFPVVTAKHFKDQDAQQPLAEQSSKGKGKTHKSVNKQTKSVNNRKTVKTAMALTWYRHFQRNGGLNQILRHQTSHFHYS
jgi:hypothetical protein